MSQLVERKGYKIESTVPKKKKKKDKQAKPTVVQHVQIIDDDAFIPWADTQTTTIATTTTTTTTKVKKSKKISIEDVSEQLANDELTSAEDAPVIVGVIDERPADVREKERFENAKRWRTAAFEEVPERGSIGPQPKSSKASRHKQNDSDDSDPDIDRRKSAKMNDPDSSPPRRKTQPVDDDPSPPRRRRPSDDDPSPPRRKRDGSSPPRRKKDNDPSPPRRKHKHSDDPSPPRRRDRSSPSSSRGRNGRESSPTSTHRRRPKEEPSTPSSTQRRPKEDSSPPSAQPAKSQRRQLAEHKEQVAERYSQWGRGLAQVRQHEEAVQDYIETAEKPLARYRDDQDLDAMLKQREREDDPMLKYLTNKTSDTSDRSANSNKPPPKPRYKGPEPQRNRFNIWPGYRWDGVDRSNGYEKKLFDSIASRHAKAQEAYLWSVEDM